MFVHKFTRILIDILLAVCLAAVATMPFVPGRAFELINVDRCIPGVKAILALTGLLAAGILFYLHKLYSSMLSGSPFTRRNAEILGRIGWLGLIIGAAYAVKMFFLPTFGTMIVILIFLLCFLFCMTLSDLFNKAASYKEENDLTI